MPDVLFVRDFAFTALIFGVAAFVWFGWGQEDPPRAWRVILAVGAGLGVILAVVGGVLVYQNWGAETALGVGDGYRTFGIICGVEFGLAAVGAAILGITKHPAWISTWISFVVGVHFIPLAFVFDDFGLFGLAAAMAITSGVSVYLNRRTGVTPSAVVGLGSGTSLMLFAVRAAVIALVA